LAAIKIKKDEPIMDEAVERLKPLATTTVSDAMDRLGIAGQCSGVHPLDESFRLCGRAFTIRTLPALAAGGTLGDYIDDVPPGRVVAIDNAGRLDATVWGDIMTLAASKLGLAGTVLDGVCRNVSRSLELSYPVFSRGRSMRTGKNRVARDQMNVTISIGGVRVSDGDLLLGDADGVVVLPRAHESKILGLAETIDTAEAKIRRAVAAGIRLDEARRTIPK